MKATPISNLKDMLEFLEENNLTKTGSNYTMLCPFHEEVTPSFVVALATKKYYCFGCLASGDIQEVDAVIWGEGQ